MPIITRWWSAVPFLAVLGCVCWSVIAYRQGADLESAIDHQQVILHRISDVEETMLDLHDTILMPQAEEGAWDFHYARYELSMAALDQDRLDEGTLDLQLIWLDEKVGRMALVYREVLRTRQGVAQLLQSDPALAHILDDARAQGRQAHSTVRGQYTYLTTHARQAALDLVLAFSLAFTFLIGHATVYFFLCARQYSYQAGGVMGQVMGRLITLQAPYTPIDTRLPEDEEQAEGATDAPAAARAKPLRSTSSMTIETVEAVFDQADVGMAVLDAEGGILKANQALGRMLKKPAFGIIGMPFRTLVTVEERVVTGTSGRGLKTETTTWVRLPGVPNERFEGQLSLIELHDAEGDVQGSVAVIEDVSARVALQVAEREARQQATELAQVKEAFMSNVNHELRTPLTVIKGYASLLESDATHAQREHIAAIQASCNRLIESVGQVLQLADLDAGTLTLENTHLDLRHHVERPLARLKLEAKEKGLGFIFRAPQEPVMLQADGAVLERVAQQLVDNAIKFTEKGFVTVLIKSDAQYGYLHVRDTGEGIPADFVPQVFEPFRQASAGNTRHHDGMGIGLSVVRRLVEQMGGQVRVKSTEGKGTQVTVAFRRAQAQIHSLSTPQAAPDASLVPAPAETPATVTPMHPLRRAA